MKFVLRYRPEVVTDLDAGRRWYEERSVGSARTSLSSAPRPSLGFSESRSG